MHIFDDFFEILADFFELLAPVFLFLLIVAVGLSLLLDYHYSYQCGNYQKITGKETKHVFMDACYIATSDGWQRWDEYKIRAAASEGLKAAP